MSFDQKSLMQDAGGEEFSFGLDDLKTATAAERVDEAIARLASFPLLDPDPIIETDRDGIITYLNPSARMAFHNIFSVGDRYTLLEDPAQAMEAAKRSVRGEIVREASFSGISFEQHISCVPEIGRVRVHMHDVTEHKLREKLKSEFVNIVSHELRTPLTITREGISLILDGTAGRISGDQERILKTAKTSIDRLVRLVNDLLDSAKIEAGAVLLNRGFFDLKTAIRSVSESFAQKALNKGLKFETEIPEGGAAVYADEDKIVQVLVNLVNNALKFTTKGAIKIVLRAEEEEFVCEVSDTGTGIPPDDMTKIFDKFQQIKQGEISSEKGTGLGLMISKGLIEMHGGSIFAKSEVGKGSSFFFTLPKYSPDILLSKLMFDSIKVAAKTGGKMSLVLVQIGKGRKPKIDEKTKSEAKNAIKSCLRGSRDVVYPLADEIAVVLEGCDAAAREHVMSRIRASLGEQGQISMGAATYPDDATVEKDLLSIARKSSQIS